jgi:hypothetical protein
MQVKVTVTIIIFKRKKSNFNFKKEIDSNSIISNANQLEELLSQRIDELKICKINLTRNKVLLNETLMEYFKV